MIEIEFSNVKRHLHNRREYEVTEKEYKQIKIRVSPKEHQLLAVAAAMEGVSQTEFICKAAIEAARKLLGDDVAVKSILAEDVGTPDGKKKKASGSKAKK